MLLFNEVPEESGRAGPESLEGNDPLRSVGGRITITALLHVQIVEEAVDVEHEPVLLTWIGQHRGRNLLGERIQCSVGLRRLHWM